MKIIVGLGNPEDKYKNTRHNAGFMVLEKLAEKLNIELINNKYMSGDVGMNDEVLLLKPNTFVNKSGESIIATLKSEGIEKSDVWIIHDDTEFPLGEVRIKFGGTSGGHNGIKSIDEAIGESYWRIRIGVGRPENRDFDLADYVLANFSSDEKPILDTVIDQTVSYLLKCLTDKQLIATSFNTNTNA